MVNRPEEGESVGPTARLWLTELERVNHLEDLCVRLGKQNCENWI